MSLSRTIAQSIIEHEIPAKQVVHVLESYGLLALLPQITEEAERIVSSKQEENAIKIESPFPLSNDALARIKRIVGNDLAETDVSINPSLLAGFKARWKGRLYDGSAERIIKQLIQNQS